MLGRYIRKTIEAEDKAVGLRKYASSVVGQLAGSWSCRVSMDLRDEVAGIEATLRVGHFLQTGLEMFTSIGEQGYMAEKAESGP